MWKQYRTELDDENIHNEFKIACIRNNITVSEAIKRFITTVANDEATLYDINKKYSGGILKKK